jgi:hypothetical protein
MSARIRHGSIFLPLVLIGLGIVFLLTNLGVVDWDVWESLVLFWPVLLIALGLDLILGRGILRGLLAFVIVAVVLGGVAFAVYEFGGSERWAETTEPVSQALEGASRAEVRLAFGSGTLEVGALADPALLVQGEIALARVSPSRRRPGSLTSGADTVDSGRLISTRPSRSRSSSGRGSARRVSTLPISTSLASSSRAASARPRSVSQAAAGSRRASGAGSVR